MRDVIEFEFTPVVDGIELHRIAYAIQVEVTIPPYTWRDRWLGRPKPKPNVNLEYRDYFTGDAYLAHNGTLTVKQRIQIGTKADD